MIMTKPILSDDFTQEKIMDIDILTTELYLGIMEIE